MSIERPTGQEGVPRRLSNEGGKKGRSRGRRPGILLRYSEFGERGKQKGSARARRLPLISWRMADRVRWLPMHVKKIRSGCASRRKGRRQGALGKRPANWGNEGEKGSG